MTMTAEEQKASTKLRHAEWRARNPEKIKAWGQKYHKANKDRMRESNIRRLRERYARNRLIMEKAKDVPCQDCGERYPPYVMDFDHRDPTTKAAKVSSMHHTSVKRLVAEIAKCDVVCANCHRERSWGDSYGD